MDPRKKLLTSLIFTVCNVILLFVALIVSFAYVSHGWFSSNPNTTATGMGISTKDTFYELSRNSSAVDVHEDDGFDAVLTFFEGEGYSSTSPTTPTSRNLFCNIKKEWPTSHEGVTIEPGAFGYISFDIVLSEDVDYVFDISLNLIGVKLNAQTGVLSFLDTSGGVESAVNELLKGHILLFQTREEISEDLGHYYYSDQIEDTFTFDTSTSVKTVIDGKTHCKVEIYWIWAISFAQIALEPDDAKLHTYPLFKPTSVENTEREEILEYITTNKQKYFYEIGNPDLSSSNYQNELFNLLSNGYNNGDQLIGDTIRYVGIEAKVQPSA